MSKDGQPEPGDEVEVDVEGVKRVAVWTGKAWEIRTGSGVLVMRELPKKDEGVAG